MRASSFTSSSVGALSIKLWDFRLSRQYVREKVIGVMGLKPTD